MTRREAFAKLAWAGGVVGLPFYIQATAEVEPEPETEAQREAKPLTTASLASSLLRLADKAERQGMRREAQAIYQAVKVVMDGTPAKDIIPCDTDTDCERKNGRPQK